MHIHRRVRPWLGTMVEVGLMHIRSDTLHEEVVRAMDAAFAAVARVHGSMSYQDAGSDLSRFNAFASGEWMQATHELAEVLAFSRQLSAATDGIFDVCCEGADWRALEIDSDQQRIRKLAPLHADLGGVAKGYAVDCAVMALREAGIEAGWINAGGDARVFGDVDVPLRVRSPSDPSQLHDCAVIADNAAATSARYWVDRPHLRNGKTRSTIFTSASWTVCAPTCMAADALTKVVAATSDIHHPVLTRHGARAWIFH